MKRCVTVYSYECVNYVVLYMAALVSKTKQNVANFQWIKSVGIYVKMTSNVFRS